MSKPQFTETAWEEYLYWLTQDKRTIRKINDIIEIYLCKGHYKDK